MSLKLQKCMLLFLFCLIFALFLPVENDNTPPLIRLHVIANSDNYQDQLLKHRVRDKIMGVLGPKFTSAEDLDSARKIARNSLQELEMIAKEEIKATGKNYGAEVKVGTFDFPVKWYGYFALPSGKYEALKVILGEGRGSNWWCVLFPPLCFVDISTGLAEDSEKVERVITSLKEDNFKNLSEVEVRFKLIEVLKELPLSKKLKDVFLADRP